MKIDNHGLDVLAQHACRQNARTKPTMMLWTYVLLSGLLCRGHDISFCGCGRGVAKRHITG